MALRKIVTVGDPILTKVCRPVTKFDQKLAILIEDMIETMHEANGVGLAGPQVGVMRRLCVVDTGEEDVELVNPEIVEVSAETQTGVEGCLSLPGKYGIVTRPEHVVIRAQDRNGDWYEYEGDDIVARCFLHEIDHLDGHMYTEIAEKMLTPEELEELTRQEEAGGWRMRLVFMGTPDFAKACLETLYTDGFDIAAVYTKIDTPKNRGMKLIPSPVKEYALSVGLPVYQPQSFRDEEAVRQLRELKPDLLVVVAYGKILPQAVLDIPKYGAINMHGSILPQLRGSAPVQRSILNHCDEAGVTAMYLSAGMDEGDIVEIRKTLIQPLETSEELMARLAQIAAPLIAPTPSVPLKPEQPCASRRTAPAPTYAPMLSKEDSPIDWNQPARFIVDHVRGLVPSPVATAGTRRRRNLKFIV